MTPQLTSMTYVFMFGFITGDSLGANKLGQSFAAEMTKTTMPQGGSRNGGECRCADAGRREERV